MPFSLSVYPLRGRLWTRSDPPLLARVTLGTYPPHIMNYGSLRPILLTPASLRPHVPGPALSDWLVSPPCSTLRLRPLAPALVALGWSSLPGCPSLPYFPSYSRPLEGSDIHPGSPRAICETIEKSSFRALSDYSGALVLLRPSPEWLLRPWGSHGHARGVLPSLFRSFPVRSLLPRWLSTDKVQSGTDPCQAQGLPIWAFLGLCLR